MKARVLLAKDFENASTAGIQASIQSWLTAAGEIEFVQAHFFPVGTSGQSKVGCIIFYTK